MNAEDYISRIDSDYYGNLAPVLIHKQKMILEEVGRILASLAQDPEHAPAEHIRTRIKRAESLEKKLEKQGFAPGAVSGVQNLTDIIGVRIVTHFVGDVYSVLGEIKASPLWQVTLIKDYISYPKPNGYRSLHAIIEFPAEVPGGHLSAEIQLRTIAMDCWASLEHQLKYKKDIENAELIVSELKRCADEIASTDLTLQTLREIIRSSSSATTLLQ